MKNVRSLRLLFILLVCSVLIGGCSNTTLPTASTAPSPIPLPVYSVESVRTSLEKGCYMTFNDVIHDGALERQQGREPEEIVTVDITSQNNQVTQAVLTIHDDGRSAVWMGFSSYTGACVTALGTPFGIPRLSDWYYEHNEESKAVRDESSVEVFFEQKTADNQMITVTVLNAATISNTPQTESSESAVCGEATTANLDGKRLNVRREPGITSDIVAKLDENQTVQVLCSPTQTIDATEWVHITAITDNETISGWASNTFLKRK